MLENEEVYELGKQNRPLLLLGRLGWLPGAQGLWGSSSLFSSFVYKLPNSKWRSEEG